MFTLQVKKNNITVDKVKNEIMTSGSQNVYPIQFMFSQEWNYLEKVAVFATDMTKDGPKENPVYNQLLDKTGRCIIPWEVNLVHSKHVYVGVYGCIEGKVVLPTVWADLGNIVLGVTTGIEPEPPTPDLYQQILAELGKIRGEVEDFLGTSLKIFSDQTISNVKDLGQLPRSVVMDGSSFATAPSIGVPAMTWPFINEVVYVRYGTYPDQDQNERPAIFVTDMTGKTYACHYNGDGDILDMNLVEDPPIQWNDVKGKPDMSLFTRTRYRIITLEAMKWNANKEQTIELKGILGDKTKQLIIPIPTEASQDTYYTCDIKLIAQEEGKLTFRAYATPSLSCSLYIYALNTTDVWEGDGDGDVLLSGGVQYKFDDDFDLTKDEEDAVTTVSVKTVDTLDVENKELPMSVAGVEKILGEIRDRLADL